MKVYLVESLECDWETYTLVDGVFLSAELAEMFIRQRYSMVEVSENHKRDGEVHFYGYCTNVPDSEIYQDEDGDYYYYVCSEDGNECYSESIGNQYSITIKEVDVIEDLEDWEFLEEDIKE